MLGVSRRVRRVFSSVRYCVSAITVGAFLTSGVSAQTPVPALSRPIAPLAGPYYTPASGQSLIGFYGTDLGFTIKHEGNLRILFGDTWSTQLASAIGPLGDDSQAAICLQPTGCPLGGSVFATGDQVVAYAGNQPDVRSRRGPAVVFRRNLFSLVAPLLVHAGGPISAPLTMGILDTPAAAFSNGLSGAASGAFALFVRNEAVTCTTSCAGGFSCDTGVLGTTSTGAACLLGSGGCTRPAGNGGLCVDETSPRRDATPAGRLRSALFRMRVGNADPLADEVYYTTTWDTHKFVNPASVTVENYNLPKNVVGHMRVGAATVADPNPSSGPDNKTEKVFIWGRPWFASSSAAPSPLYLAVVELPSYTSSGAIPWKPWYFAGVDPESHNPRFSELETDAVPVPDPTGATVETYDAVNQHSVRYIPQLNKWMMLYGGDVPNEALLQDIAIVRDPESPVLVRFADKPWGPWTVKAPLYFAGNSATGTGAFGPGGIAHSPACVGPSCTPAEPAISAYFGRDEPGHFYGVNIIPEWTVDRGSTIEVFWNVSTYAPYQVFLMRSTITK